MLKCSRLPLYRHTCLPPSMYMQAHGLLPLGNKLARADIGIQQTPVYSMRKFTHINSPFNQYLQAHAGACFAGRATTAYDILYALRHTHPTGSHLKPGAFFSLSATPPSAFTKQSLNSNLFLSSSLSPYEQFEVLCAWTGWQIESNEDRSDRMGLVTQGLKRRQRAHDEAHQLLASGTKGRMVKGGGVRTEAGVIGNLESLVLLHAQWQVCMCVMFVDYACCRLYVQQTCNMCDTVAHGWCMVPCQQQRSAMGHTTMC